MKLIKSLFLLSIVYFFLLRLVYAQWDLIEEMGKWIAYWFKLPPELTAEPRDWLAFVILPFIAIWAICLGFLRQIRFFSRTPHLELILSFAMAFSTAIVGFFAIFVSFLLSAAGFWAVLLFFVMFFVGSFLYARGWIGTVRTTEAVIKELTKEEEDIKKQIAETEVAYGQRKISEKKYKEEIKKLREKLEEIKTRKITLLKEF